MTLPELEIDADNPRTVSLHARLTIIEADPALRAAVVAAVAAAAKTDPAIVTRLGLVSPKDLRAQLGDGAHLADDDDVLARAVVDHEVAEAEHDAVLGALDLASQRKLDLRTERTATKAKLDAARPAQQPAHDLAAPHEYGLELLARATASLDESTTTATADITTDGTDTATADGDTIAGAATGAEAPPAPGTAALQARLALADHLESLDVIEVRLIDSLRLDAIEALQNGLSVDDVAASLLDAWGQLDATEAIAAAVVQQVEERVAGAQRALDDADRATRPGLIDPADRRAIEAAHDDLLAAEEAASKRFASPGARRRREEAREVQQQVLGRFGFTFFEHYVLANAVAAVEPGAKERHSEAIENLTVAEQELLWATEQRRETLQSHEQPRADVRSWATTHLGYDPGDELETALRGCLALPALPETLEQTVRDLGREAIERRDQIDQTVHALEAAVARLEGEIADLDRRARELRSRALQVVAELETRRRAQSRAEEAAQAAAGRRVVRTRSTSPAGMDNAIEYLSERLAGLTAQHDASRVPLVLDDALSVLPTEALPPVLAWLAAAAKGRQVVCLVADLDATVRGFRLDPSSGTTTRLATVAA